jgi:hypothetical protein
VAAKDKISDEPSDSLLKNLQDRFIAHLVLVLLTFLFVIFLYALIESSKNNNLKKISAPFIELPED